ncbi:MAG: isoprenylcysteine carboxylmethyltransferase family protein [Syntrophobacteraceae bacterium]
MAERMTFWGVGPRLALLSFGYSIVPFFLTLYYPEYFVISSIPASVFNFAGIILLAVGIPFWALSARTIARGFKDGVLCTHGVYSIVRHPVYSALIVFVIPGFLMFFRSWALLTVPFCTYLIFKRLIGREENYLEERFGEEYLKYKSRCNAIVPTIFLFQFDGTEERP